ncbi:Serine/threonine-protein phosphatase 4 regulatory subunit 1 [Araneus ventricosus]|uniref:Serine/threonine-protein phosphatase 4 regulatory subunit 1 n=1 Tax=Araneus ventricosus TaxID=182803 RepID=A0A4Y2KN44_ARAVE|nr:Serine/threonine-protein phosphatase 4 regulatory subunit 1 [Araneus ventricosus]
MKRLSEHSSPVYTKAVLSELTEKFVHSPKWLHRQLYVYICQQIILDKALSPDQFAEDALPQLLYLCWDRVPNVRIAIARCLVVVIWPLDVFSNPKSPHRELLLQTIHTLQSDMDADVRFYANMVSTHECSCLQNGEFTNMVEPFV